MSTGTELGKAYVQIVPSARGISGQISAALKPEAAKAGKESGEEVSKSLTERMSEKLGAVSSKFGAIGKTASSVGGTLTRSITVPLGGVGVAAAKVGMDFDAEMSKVSAISGATGADFDQLRAKAREMGSKTKYSATEAGQGFEYMAMAGWKTDDMLAGIEPTLKLAAASGEDLGTTSDIVTDSLTGFGLSAKDTGRLANVMAAASSNANTNVSMMGETFKYAASVAGAYGYTVEDTALMTGLLANSGIKASQAGTTLRSIMSRLATDAGASSKNLGALGTLTEKLGVEFYNADGSMRPLRDVINDSRKAWAGLTEEEKANYAKKIAGQNAMSGWMALMESSEGDVKKLTNAIDNSDGSLDKMYDTMTNNFAGALDEMKSALQEAGIVISDMLTPYLRKAATWVKDMAVRFSEASPAVQKTIVVLGAVAASIGPVLITIGKMSSGISALTGAGSKLMLVLPKIGAVIGGISLPMVAVAAVIGVLVAAFVHLWKTNEGFRDAMTAIWNRLKGAFQIFGQGITDRLNSLGFHFKSFKDVIKAAWDGITRFLAPVFQAAFSTVVTIVETALGVILGAVDFFIAVFKGDWKGAFKALSGIFQTAWTGVKKIFSAQLTAIRKLLGGVLTNIRKSWSKAWDSVRTATKRKVEDIKNAVKRKLVDGIRTALGKIGFVKKMMSSAFESAKKAVSTKISSIKSAVSSKLVGGIKSALGKLGFIKSKLSSAFESAKKAVTGKVDSIKNTVKNAFAKLKISIPKPHIPKVTVTWTEHGVGDLKVKIPTIHWNAAGGIFNRPTVLQGVGEAGAEAVIPLTQLWKRFDALADSIVSGVATVAAAGAGGGGDIHLAVYLYPNGPKMMEETVKAYDTGKRRGLK